jgi:hypothetical protein
VTRDGWIVTDGILLRLGEPVTVVWGDHPGPGTPADADLGIPRIRATVRPAPYNEHARTAYRR